MRETPQVPVTSPREFDEQLADLGAAQTMAARALDHHRARMHRAAGDKQEVTYVGRRSRRAWGMTPAEVVTALEGLPDGAALLAEHARLAAKLDELTSQVAAMDATYRAAPWQRYFPCRAHNGHIHASERGCHTIGPATEMGWRPDLSGRTVAEAVADLGEALCTHCFPGAPAEWTAKTLTQVERERTAGDRAAEHADRSAVQAAKNLTRDEWFDDGMDGRVTTVAGAKQALRDEREMAHYHGLNKPHSWHPKYVEAAKQARAVLAGRGVTAAEIDQIVARAEAKQQREWKAAR